MPARVVPKAASFVAKLAQNAAGDDNLKEAAKQLLLPLLLSDKERGSDLVATLRSYYACGGSVMKTAEVMFLHRNSVRYRLDRVRFLLRTDIDAPHNAAALVFAITVTDVA